MSMRVCTIALCVCVSGIPWGTNSQIGLGNRNKANMLHLHILCRRRSSGGQWLPNLQGQRLSEVGVPKLEPEVMVAMSDVVEYVQYQRLDPGNGGVTPTCHHE